MSLIAKHSITTQIPQQLVAAKYFPYLPTEEELRRELEQERAKIEESVTVGYKASVPEESNDE